MQGVHPYAQPERGGNTDLRKDRDNAKGALILSTSRQGTCFIPILYPMAMLLGSVGLALVQAVADVLSLLLAVPIMRGMNRTIAAAEQARNEDGAA